jgi:hypothetical protein
MGMCLVGMADVDTDQMAFHLYDDSLQYETDTIYPRVTELDWF